MKHSLVRLKGQMKDHGLLFPKVKVTKTVTPEIAFIDPN